MKSRRIVRSALLLMGLHLALMGGLHWISNEAPVNHLHLTTRQDGVLLFGHNRLGLLTVKHFDRWADAIAYLDAQKIAIPTITHSEPQTARDLKLEGLRGEAGYKVVWQSDARKAVFFTPDYASAIELASFIRYQSSRIQASPFGLSLALD